MKKLLSILVLGLLISGNAYSKIVDLHCEYVQGHIIDKVPHPGHADNKKIQHIFQSVKTMLKATI